MKIGVIPQIPMIGSDAERLYALEAKRQDAIRAAAKELAKVLGHDAAQFYTVTMPEALANVLESYTRETSVPAALGYLAQYGSVVFTPTDGSPAIGVEARPR